jgi:hypothetical protein
MGYSLNTNAHSAASSSVSTGGNTYGGKTGVPVWAVVVLAGAAILALVMTRRKG